MYQVISKQTNKVVREHFAYSPLEAEYADSASLYFIRNADTGVEWEIKPEETEQKGVIPL